MTTYLIAVLAGAALFVLALTLPQKQACNGSSCGACGAACNRLPEDHDDEAH